MDLSYSRFSLGQLDSDKPLSCLSIGLQDKPRFPTFIWHFAFRHIDRGLDFVFLAGSDNVYSNNFSRSFAFWETAKRNSLRKPFCVQKQKNK